MVAPERKASGLQLLKVAGWYIYYGRVGGCLVTGNEDGIKHIAMNMLYSMHTWAYTIPQQSGWG